MKPYLYFDGLISLIPQLRGDERIHVGIRPYGFHAGNALALIAYPFLLCKYCALAGKKPRFTFFVSINDYEQDLLAGPDPIRYPFNTYPTVTSLQYTPDEAGCCKSTTDHWEPAVKKNLNFLTEKFPNITINIVRNSSLKATKPFRDLFFLTLNKPQEFAAIFKKYSGKEVLDEPLTYGGVVCPRCHHAHGTTRVEDGRVNWSCAECAYSHQAIFEEFDYWWYHKPMLVARLKLFKIDVALSGGDHYDEGDFRIRQELIKRFAPEIPEPRMLFTPLLLALDGRKMSKSRNNTAPAHIERLIAFADQNPTAILRVTKNILRAAPEKSKG